MGEHPERLAAAIAGALGALIAAAGVAISVFFAVNPPDVRARWRVLWETVAAVVAGFVAAYELSPTVARWLGLTQPHDLAACGFILGVLFWRLLPPIIAVAESIMRARGEKLK